MEVTKDFFDSSLGSHAAINSQGVPCILVTLTPQGAKLIVDAVRYWQEHNCSAAIEMGLYVLHQMAAEVQPLIEHLPEVKDWEAFPHKVD